MAGGKVHIELAELDIVVGVVAINALLVLLEDDLHRSSLFPVPGGLHLAGEVHAACPLVVAQVHDELVLTMLSNAGPLWPCKI